MNMPKSGRSKQAYHDYLVRLALSGIIRIEPFIDRIELSGDYQYNDVVSGLGRLKIDSSLSLGNGYKNPKYRTKAYCQLQTERLSTHLGPKIGFLPDCLFTVISPSATFLKQIDNALPGLNLSSVELGIDFICRDHECAARLFHIITRHLYVPFGGNYWMSDVKSGGRYDGIKLLREKNAVFSISSKKNGKAGMFSRLYERGPDDKEIEPSDEDLGMHQGWYHKKIDRVRLEFVFKRGGSKLRKLGLLTLNSLFHTLPSTYLLFTSELYGRDTIQFRRFVKHSKLPKDGDVFPGWHKKKDKKIIECFQEEYWKWKTKIKNINQYTENIPVLEKFKAKMKDACIKHDLSWSAEAHDEKNSTYVRYYDPCSILYDLFIYGVNNNNPNHCFDE